jgi:hypothetical protein
MTTPVGRTQVNIRLESEEADLLAAVAFLSDQSAAEVLRPVIRAFLEDQRNDPDVTAAARIRAKHRAE